MTDTRATRTRWLGMLAVVGALAVALACAPTTARLQTPIMEKSGKVSVSAAVLRARVNDLVERVAGRIQLTADRIRAEADDDALRLRALALKIDAVPAVYSAGFRADPLSAAVDVWGLAFQFSHYMDTGAGLDAFGPQQPLVQECARGLLADADSVIRGIAIRPEYFDEARTTVENWAKSHPVEQAFSSRASGGALLADLQTAERDVFLAVGTVSDVIENLSERLNTYVARLPQHARWHAELLMTEMARAHNLDSALGTIADVGTAARRATGLVDELPVLLDAQRNVLATERRAILAEVTTERRAILAEVNSQRALTLEFLAGERVAVLAAAREERSALVAALRQERIETLREVDAIKTRAVDSTLAGLEDLVDYTLWRVAILTLGLMLAAATLGVIAYWLTADRRRGAVGG